jgi:hypothetical protein
LDKLTHDEALMATAQVLKLAHTVDDKVTNIEGKVTGIDDKVTGIDDKVKVVIDGAQSFFQFVAEAILRSLHMARRKRDKRDSQGSKYNHAANGT